MSRSPSLCACALVLSVAASAAAAGDGRRPDFWWPDHLDLSPLRQHARESDPLGGDFDYAAAFSTLDLAAVKRDIAAALTASQPWWPADYGHYGPLFIRMAWHSAGTYRVGDGRGGGGGGQQRFEPLNSWPDNVNLDKARRLLWPIKQKYGQKISWGDLMVLTGNVALEAMGMPTLGFGGGRRDEWEPDLVYWGPERTMLAATRYTGERKLAKPLAAAQMGLIYVNPQGPGGNPDPLASARDIRELFGRMAMDDEETVALIAGGHTFGKAHGAHDPGKCLGPEPAAAPIEAQGMGWASRCGTGHGADAVTSGLEGAWSGNPTAWTSMYLDNLFEHTWVKSKSPAGAIQWVPADGAAAGEVPDASDPNRRHPPIMFTTDIALKEDPTYRAVAMRFRAHPEAFQSAFAHAWFKLTHRDMGPRARYLGREVPRETQSWQDPVPPPSRPALAAGDVARLRAKIVADGLPVADLVRVAWAAAASFRGTDMRGGANGARLALAPQSGWAVNDPPATAAVLRRLRAVQEAFNRGQKGRAQASLADVIVLAGSDAVERAARAAGERVAVPFAPGRTDATQAQTDVASFANLEPTADGFRNYYAAGQPRPPAEMLIERAELLRLSVPEMTVLLGGLRVLGANAGASPHGVLTDRPGRLTPDFFVNLLDMSTEWSKSATAENLYEGRERATHRPRWTATSVDLLFGSNAELRAVAEVYAQGDARAKFVHDFVRAWVKVMNLDRFDLKWS